MAVKYKMDEGARDTLDMRVESGTKALETHDSYASEEAETTARDLVSDILTRLFGPAGYCVEINDAVSPFRVTLDGEHVGLAWTFLDMALESWKGDAEDYTATVVTVDEPQLVPAPKRRLVLEISEVELAERVQGTHPEDEIAAIRDYGSVVKE